jgi:hypothetical protein
MVDDDSDKYSNENENTGGGGGGNSGGGGGLMQLLPLAIGLLIRKPILLLVVLAVGAIFYFKGGCHGMGNLSNIAQQFQLGGNLNKDSFAKASVYEGLDESKNDLPEAVSLLKYAPQRKNQGQQGSCVAWSSAYAARTILESSSKGIDPDKTAFSPSFLYNQIKLDGCQGSYIIRAMETMTKTGAVPFNDFPYDDKDCDKQPNGQLIQEATDYKMLGFTRLTGDEGTKIDLHAIKEHLAKDLPVVIGMMVGGSYMQDMMGKDVWHPTEDDYTMNGFGGHAQCVIGYDDRKDGGAFQIMNSWGSDWGNNGVGWVLYKDFKHFVREAYGLNPMPKEGSAIAQNLSCSIGLVEAKSKKYIPLKVNSGNNFETASPIAKGTAFKMEVKNDNACYIYVLGKETDGSSYVLFPYPSKDDATKTKYSPYCGITGYRLFPRGMSMQADEVGDKDYIAVITSSDSLNVFQLNDLVNQNKSQGFETAVNAAIRRQSVGGVQFNAAANGTIAFKTPIGDKSAVACIVAIDKN